MIGLTLLKVGMTAMCLLVLFLFMDAIAKHGEPANYKVSEWISVPGGLCFLIGLGALVAGAVCLVWGV